MSFLKYANDPEVTRGNGRGPVSFTRAKIDGMPFRGNAPMLKEEEFQEHTHVASDVYVQQFDMSVPEQLNEYRKVLDKIRNGLYRLIWRDHRWVERKGEPVMIIFMEWDHPALEFHGIAP